MINSFLLQVFKTQKLKPNLRDSSKSLPTLVEKVISTPFFKKLYQLSDPSSSFHRNTRKNSVQILCLGRNNSNYFCFDATHRSTICFSTFRCLLSFVRSVQTICNHMYSTRICIDIRNQGIMFFCRNALLRFATYYL